MQAYETRAVLLLWHGILPTTAQGQTQPTGASHFSSYIVRGTLEHASVGARDRGRVAVCEIGLVQWPQ
jgi:hypothetical protein